jgi:hypothetical protein
MILQLTTEICVSWIIFVLCNQKLVCFARFVCVADHFLFSGTKFGFALQDFFGVVDHFCSLKQWVGMSFLADFCDDGSKP